MRENCTYGSMRGRAYPITRGVPLYSTPFRNGGRMINKLVVLLVAAGMSMTLCAMPTAEEQEKVRPLVQGLMKPDLDAMKQGKKSRSDVAKSAMDLYSKADSPAAKMLLARNALNLYAKAGEYEAAESALDALLAAVPDYPAADIAELLEKTLHPIPNRAAPNLRARLAAVKDKAQAASQLKKLLPVYGTLAEGPKRKACAARIASAYVALDDWPNANKYFAVSDSPAAAAASAELKLQDEPEASRPYDKPADAWWLVELPKKDAKLSAAIRTHAAALYAKSLPSLKGLAKVQAERRIAEVESAAEAASAKSEKISSSAIPAVGTAKYYGVELIGGSVKDEKGELSGFTKGSFAKLKSPFAPGKDTFEVVIEFTTGQQIGSSGLFGCMGNMGFIPFSIVQDNLVCYLSSNGLNDDIASGQNLGIKLVPKTTYRVKCEWEGKNYAWSIWRNGQWVCVKKIPGSVPVNGGQEMQIGTNRLRSNAFLGSVNLCNSYICIARKLWWEGVKGAYKNANR